MRKLKLLTISLLCFFLTGCVSYMELNELGIVDMIVIDKIDKNFVISINMITPTKEELEESVHYTVEASSLEEGLNKLYLESSKKVSLAHIELLCLTENIKKDDLDIITNLFLNRNDARNTFSTMIINGNYDTLLDFKSLDINELININNEEYGVVSIKQFDEIIKEILEMKISYIPTLKINSDNKLEIEGYSSIYEQEKKLSIKESVGLNLITNNIKKSLISTNDIDYKLESANTTVKTNKNKVTIDINATFNILSNNSKIQDKKELQNKFNKELKDIINDYLDNNKLNYFYYLISKYDAKYYKENKDIKLKFDINITSSINENSNIKGGDNFETRK